MRNLFHSSGLGDRFVNVGKFPFSIQNNNAIFKDIRFLPTAVIFQMLFYTKPHLLFTPSVMLLYAEDLLDTSPCYLLIVQHRSCVVSVLVLTLLTRISCWLLALHLVDNAGFVKNKKKQPVTAVIVFSPAWSPGKNVSN